MASSALLSESMHTLGGMVAAVKRWVQEPIRVPGIVEDAVNDSYEELWMASILATLSRFTAGAQPLALSGWQAGTQAQVQIVSIPDPTSAPAATTVAGGSSGARTVLVAVAWVTESGTSTKISPTTTLSVGANQLVQVSAIAPVANAFAYFVYAGLTSGSLILQNPESTQFNRAWTEPTPGIADEGTPPPAASTTGDNIFAIASLQVQNQDGTYTRWEQADVSTTFIRQQQTALPTGTSYQRQAYDLLGGGSLQIFPGPGTSLSANYWYVVKPRRMMFTGVPLPFNDFPSQAFIRQRSLAYTLGHLSEWEGLGTWNGLADKQLAAIVKALTVPDRQKNLRVRPYLAGGMY